MNYRQLSKIQIITNQLTRQRIDGALSFSVQPLQMGSFLLAATNIYSGLKWHERTCDFYAIIGPRGGVRRYAGNLHQ